MRKSCFVVGCGRKRESNGLCRLHFDRVRLGSDLIHWREIFIHDNPPVGDKAKIPVSKTEYCVVDAEDYGMLISRKWHKSTQGYAYTTMSNKHVFMHRLLLAFPECDVDHVNRKRLDNRKRNLRTASRQMNMCNITKTKRGVTSKFNGVCFDKSKGKFVASIGMNGRSKFIGRFDSEIEAAKAYDKAVLAKAGEYAVTNFLPQ